MYLRVTVWVLLHAREVCTGWSPPLLCNWALPLEVFLWWKRKQLLWVRQMEIWTVHVCKYVYLYKEHSCFAAHVEYVTGSYLHPKPCKNSKCLDKTFALHGVGCTMHIGRLGNFPSLQGGLPWLGWVRMLAYEYCGQGCCYRMSLVYFVCGCNSLQFETQSGPAHWTQ